MTMTDSEYFTAPFHDGLVSVDVQSVDIENLPDPFYIYPIRSYRPSICSEHYLNRDG